VVSTGSGAWLTGADFVNVHGVLAIGQALHLEFDRHFLHAFGRHLFLEPGCARDRGVRAALKVGNGSEAVGRGNDWQGDEAREDQFDGSMHCRLLVSDAASFSDGTPHCAVPSSRLLEVRAGCGPACRGC
jgi:hypothetical protein